MAFGISAGAAALIGGGLSAVGSIIGGSQQSSAAQNAANTQAQASEAAIAEQKRQFDINQANQAPWLQAGKNALGQLTSGNFDVRNTPGYQFRLDEGLKALDRSAAARGGLLSGATLKGAQRYGQDYASNEYTNAYNRTANLAGVGQTAANNLGSYGQAYATNVGNSLADAANARASGYVGSANAISNAFGGVSNAFTNYNLMRALNNPTYTASTGGYSSGGGVNAFL
jgi:hypothetical protein